MTNDRGKSKSPFDMGIWTIDGFKKCKKIVEVSPKGLLRPMTKY